VRTENAKAAFSVRVRWYLPLVNQIGLFGLTAKGGGKTMAIFDSLISEVAQKFGLGNKAEGLLAGLLSLITSTDSGGLTGFISKFTGAGLGNVVNSWINRGENTALTNDQLSSVLGNDTIRNLADKAGIASATATPALAYMLPKVVDGLTPDGVVPTNLPDTMKSYIAGLGGMLGRGVGTVTGASEHLASSTANLAGKGFNTATDLAGDAAGAVGASASAVGAGLTGAAGAVGSGARAAAGAVGSGAKAAAEIAGDTARSGMSGLLRLLPLLLLALVAFLGYRYCSSSTNPTTQQATAPTPAAVPAINSKLDLTVVDGKIKASGIVPDEATKASVLNQLKATYGDGKYLDDKLVVDAKARPAQFAANLNKALGEFKLPGTNGSQLSFDGSAINITGLVGTAADALKTKLMGFFGNAFNINLKVLDTAAAVKDAAAAATGALASLKPGDADALVSALNLQIINFASGSNAIPKENEDLLKKSADAIKAAPSGIKLEVGGHTDNKGAAAGNLALSQRRADAVRAFLVKQGVKGDLLSAKGYGADNPIASNDTDADRFRNRRIAFSVVK
jgi:OmpA-OmpF porin, OOP family